MDIREQDREFVTTEASDDVGRPHRVRDACPDLDEELITGGVTKRVVHAFEAVEID